MTGGCTLSPAKRARRRAGVGHLQPTPPGPSPSGTLRERTTGAPGAPGGGLEPEGNLWNHGTPGTPGKGMNIIWWLCLKMRGIWKIFMKLMDPNGCFHTSELMINQWMEWGSLFSEKPLDMTHQFARKW